MKWFRSNRRLGSHLALLALAIQFLLSFGHFHGGMAEAASPHVSGLHQTIGFAAAALEPSERALLADASGPMRSQTGHAPDGQPGDDCAICAVMALANAMVDAAPPCLVVPRAAAFCFLAVDAAFAELNSARVAFQPRGPPVA
jgi:hypothetical protein